MIGRRQKILADVSFAVDVVAGVILLAGIYCLLLYFGPVWQSFLRGITGYPFDIQGVIHLQDQGWLFLVIILNLFISFRLNRFYELDLFANIREVIFQSFKCLSIGVGMTAIFFYFFSIIEVNRSLLFGFAGMFFVYQVLKEIALRRYLLERYYRRKPLEAILCCPAHSVSDLIAEFTERGLVGVVVRSVVLTEGKREDVGRSSQPLLAGELDELEKILSKGSCDMVFLGGASGQAEQKVLENAEVQGIDVWYFSQLISTQLAKPEIDQYGGRPVIVFKTTSHYEGKLLLKRFFDVTVSLLFLILLSPVFLVIAFLVKITSPGPVFYTQVRTGWRGRSFRMIKFRTMRDGAEDELPALHDQNELKGPVFKSAEDPRITPLGRWLRHYSGDELPQLFNVLKGEMSLVGPRPLPTYETEKFEAFTDHRRHSVLPGLTGLWQVSGRTRIDDFSEWVRLDLQYIDTWNFWLDIVILLRTIPVVLSGKGAK